MKLLEITPNLMVEDVNQTVRFYEDEPSYATTVVVDFKPIGEDTIVSLMEHGFHDTHSGRTACLNCATGWGKALTSLKFYAEHGLRY